MRIEQFCIAVGATAALCGMSLGIAMAIRQDFTLMPAHAHLNLLGWVSMALYGLYYRGAATIRPRLAWTQAAIATVGFVAMTGGLAMLLSGDPRFEPIVSLGAICALVGMALFLCQVVTERRVPRAPASEWGDDFQTPKFRTEIPFESS